MKVLCDVFQIKPELRDAFLEALVENARGSVADEPGCLRFDVLVDEKDPNVISVYEVYTDQAAVDNHFQSSSFLHWREKMLSSHQSVKDWFAKEAAVYRWTNVLPTDADWK